MGSVTRRGLTTVIALLGGMVAVLWSAMPARAHEGVNVTVHTDGTGQIWANVSWIDGHPVTGPVTAVMLATSPDGTKRVGPIALRAAEGQAGALPYQGTLEPGQWRVSVDVASPGIATCVINLTAIAPGAGSPAPQEQVCAASFWPTEAAAAPGDGTGSFPVLAVIGAGVVLAAIALWLTMRVRRDRPAADAASGSRRPERTGGTPTRTRSR